MEYSNHDKVTLAMWSGPRNISTAMMRAWENRSDCQVWDEPFYAAYLHQTGLDHPLRDEIIEHDETDWKKVVSRCQAGSDQSSRVFYQKQMTHHILPEFSKDWLLELQHCFLLRDPAQVLKSYKIKREQVTLEDIGVPQQVALFDWICNHQEQAPLVIDSADFLRQPEAYLRAICHDINVEFQASMLSWPKGSRQSDGVWASHWYNNVWQSTGFNAPTPAEIELDSQLVPILEQAQPLYDQLYHHRLKL